jgi:uncharacterized protein YjiS (DUF1127 family)
MSGLTTTNRFISTRQPLGRTALKYRLETLRIALRTYLTRQALPELTARELADVGLNTSSALTEAARLPWDLGPRSRRRAAHGLIEHAQQALERARTRRLIARMQAREMRDIGISPSDAQTEASKPFWRQ